MPKSDFPVVGVGASAGGLKAIESLLRNLPPDTGMAYIIIQHLSRKYKSLMREILVKDTYMPIIIAEDKMMVKPNHVYLIPAGQNLTIYDYQLKVQPQETDQFPSYVIDLFFHSLGKDIQENAIAIVLSGTGTDGSRGIKTIKEAGGLVMVQEPGSGEFDGMPLSAMDTRMVDFVLSPDRIADQLKRIGSFRKKNKKSAKNNKDTTGLSESNAEIMTQILELIQKQKTVNFGYYKSNTVQRRIEKIMTARKMRDLTAYYDFLLSNKRHVEELFQEMLIGVTEFFRDPEAFEVLQKTILPKIITEAKHNMEVRIWDCACSTGEEVYSLIITMFEYCEKQNIYPKFRILATDIDEGSLAFASRGQYPPGRLASLSEDRLNRYFNYNGHSYEVKKVIRDLVIFARNDATIDPPFINLDLVICRNMLIYLQSEIQRKLLLNFHFGLKPGGFLWLGPSENILDFKHNFTKLNEKWKIFQTKGKTPNFRKYYSLKESARNSVRASTESGSLMEEWGGLSGKRKLKGFWTYLLIKKYAPSCAIFSEGFELKYLAGNAGKHLVLPDMEVSQDLLNMVSKDMVIILRDAVNRLNEADTPLLYRDVNIQDQADQKMNLMIERLTGADSEKLFLLEWKDDLIVKEKQPIQLIEAPETQPDTYAVIKSLQEELHYARQEVQNAMEELETSNEELQASNEELLASNEELQSTNEELQSVNEELYTVNSELQARNRELIGTNTTIDNLLVSTELGTLFLDKNMEIRFYTPAFEALLSLNENDIGRPLKQFSLPFDYDNFYLDAASVLKSQKPIEREIRHVKGQWFLCRITPYRSEGNDGQGVVLTFMDISKRKNAESESINLNIRQTTIFNTISQALLLIDLNGFIIFSNKKFFQMTGRDVVHSHISELVSENEHEHLKEIMHELKNEDNRRKNDIQQETEYQFNLRLKKSASHVVLFHFKLIKTHDGKPDQIMAYHENSVLSVEST